MYKIIMFHQPANGKKIIILLFSCRICEHVFTNQENKPKQKENIHGFPLIFDDHEER